MKEIIFDKLTKKGGIPMFKELETELRLRGFSDRTIQAYLSHNRLFIEFVKKHKQRSEYQATLQDDSSEGVYKHITKADIRDYLKYIITDKKLKPSSVNLILSALKFYYEEMQKTHLFDTIKHLKHEKKLPTVLSKEEVKLLLASIANQKHKLLASFLYGSGLRVSEAVALKIDDMDIPQKMMLVRQ